MAQASLSSFAAKHTERQVLTGYQKTIAMDTPLRAQIKTGPKVFHPMPDWECRKYHAVDTAGAKEGYVPTAADSQNHLDTKTMLTGRFIKKLKAVGATKEAKLMSSQYNESRDVVKEGVGQAMEEIYRDCEAQIAGDFESVAPSGTGSGATAGVSRSIFRWLSKANGRFTDTATTPADEWRTPASHIVVSKATAADVSEGDIRGLITAVMTSRNQGGMRFTGWCTPSMRDRFDDFSKIGTQSTTEVPVYRFNQKQGSVDREITFYKSSNGSIELDTCFNMDATVHFGLLTMAHYAIGYAQPLQVLPDSSTSTQVSLVEQDVIYVTMPLCLNGSGKVITGATA